VSFLFAARKVATGETYLMEFPAATQPLARTTQRIGNCLTSGLRRSACFLVHAWSDLLQSVGRRAVADNLDWDNASARHVKTGDHNWKVNAPANPEAAKFA
jgi:hypothetical protein